MLQKEGRKGGVNRFTYIFESDPPRWPSSYGARLLTRRSRHRIPAAGAAFSMKARMLEARVLRFRCTPGGRNYRSPPLRRLIIISWFWDVKPQQSLLLNYFWKGVRVYVCLNTLFHFCHKGVVFILHPSRSMHKGCKSVKYAHKKGVILPVTPFPWGVWV